MNQQAAQQRSYATVTVSASLVKRFAAGLIDGLIAAPFTGLFMLQMSTQPTVLMALGLIVTNFLVAIWFMHLLVNGGQTLGKKLLGILAVRTNGESLSWPVVIIRNSVTTILVMLSLVASMDVLLNSSAFGSFSSLTNILSLLLQTWVIADSLSALVRRDRRSLHDLMADTIVVPVKP